MANETKEYITDFNQQVFIQNKRCKRYCKKKKKQANTNLMKGLTIQCCGLCVLVEYSGGMGCEFQTNVKHMLLAVKHNVFPHTNIFYG